MKIIYHPDFNMTYSDDPAAAPGRIEAIVKQVKGRGEFVMAVPARRADILAVHTPNHVAAVEREGVYEIAALAAGGAIQAAELGMAEPSFAIIRPPGHHASAGSAWGFCYFNNIAVAITRLKADGRIKRTFIIDFDLHYGDGTVNIYQDQDWVSIYNPHGPDRRSYLTGLKDAIFTRKADIIGVSAGFDNHEEDWGGLLSTEDYRNIGAWLRQTAEENATGLFAILEGGYNHRVLGRNVAAFLDGMEGKEHQPGFST